MLASMLDSPCEEVMKLFTTIYTLRSKPETGMVFDADIFDGNFPVPSVNIAALFI